MTPNNEKTSDVQDAAAGSPQDSAEQTNDAVSTGSEGGNGSQAETPLEDATPLDNAALGSEAVSTGSDGEKGSRPDTSGEGANGAPLPAAASSEPPQGPPDGTVADPGVESGPPGIPDTSEPAKPWPHPREEDTDRPMSLMDHLNELRKCLIKACIAVFVCFIACWVVVDPIFNALVNPLLAVLPKGSHPIYTTLPEGFFIRMYIAFISGVFVASPVIFYQIWSFIAPGLYDEEKHFIIPLAFVSALFFIGGGCFCFFIVFPYAFTFFISFATEEIVAMPKISDYLNFVLKLILAFGLIFEMPLFSFFLSRMGIVTANAMRRVRRYAVLVIFIVAAILTPPDVVSQLLMAGPMLILYELSILIAVVFGKKKKQETDGEDSQPQTEEGK